MIIEWNTLDNYRIKIKETIYAFASYYYNGVDTWLSPIFLKQKPQLSKLYQEMYCT